MPSKLNIEIHRSVAVKSEFSDGDKTVCGLGRDFSRMRHRTHIQVKSLFLLYRKVLLWRTLDIKVARTEAGIANKR